MRDIADVSYDGDPNTGVLVIQGGRVFQVGGTSAGAPQWAALIALASQEYNQTFGSIDSKLYGLSSFHDITAGSDGFFSATLGWDYPTGLGSPDASAVVDGLSPGTLVPVQTSLVSQGYNVTTRGSLSVDSSRTRFSGALSVTASNATTGSVLFSKIYGLSDIRFQGTAGGLHSSFLLNVQVSPYSLSEDLTLSFKNGTGTVSVMLTRQADFAGDGFVSINDVSVVYRDYGLRAGGQGFNPLADLDASGTISLVDIGIIDSLYGIPSFR
jgi:subtilase family serine protease